MLGSIGMPELVIIFVIATDHLWSAKASRARSFIGPSS